jgi:predicted transcriptional regulator
MAKLPEPLRVALLLSIVGGLSTGEIADMLELKEAAVRQRLSRARKQFQQVYAQESGETVFDGAAQEPAHPTNEDCVEQQQTLNDKSRRFSFTTRSSTTRRSYA